VDNAGNGLTGEFLANACPGLGFDEPKPSTPPLSGRTQVPREVVSALEDCVTTVGKTYHQVVSYHPASRYWAFQWYELGVYVAAAFALAAVCMWTIRRRRS
jgi:hypothetical protein